MPTPFHHLDIAGNLLCQAALTEPLRQKLQAQRSAFLFGNTAPDVQVISGQKRRETHFFRFPVSRDMVPPWEQMLDSHPELGFPGNLAESHAAFLAGYLCHLQADWYWIQDIFLPAFGPDAPWGTFQERLYLHNVLRSHLDLHVLRTLPQETSNLLQMTEPSRWLPFVRDEDLVKWRDYISSQLQPGAEIMTIEVFAARQGLSSKDFFQLIDSEELMEEQVFLHASHQDIDQFHAKIAHENIILLSRFFSGRILLSNGAGSHH